MSLLPCIHNYFVSYAAAAAAAASELGNHEEEERTTGLDANNKRK